MDNQNQQSPVSEPTPPPQPMVSQSSTPTTPPSKSNKFLLSFVVLVLLIAVGTGGYILATKQTPPPQQAAVATPTKPPPSPTIDATVNWKEYTDPNSLFSFRYPSDPKIIVGEKIFNSTSNPKPAWVISSVEIKRPFIAGDNSQGISPFSITLLVSKNTNNLTTEKQKEYLLKGLCPETIRSYKNRDINGLYFVACNKSSLMGLYKQQMVMYVTKDNIYEFSLNSLEGEGAQVEGKTKEYVDQILQTFKFTNQVVLPSPCPQIQAWEAPVDDEKHPYLVSDSSIYVKKDSILTISANTPTAADVQSCMRYYEQWFNAHGWVKSGFASGASVPGIVVYNKGDYYIEIGEHEALIKDASGKLRPAFIVEHSL